MHYALVIPGVGTFEFADATTACTFAVAFDVDPHTHVFVL